MSLQDVLLGPDCGVDVYEEPDEAKWVACSVRRSWVNAAIAIPIIIVVVLVLLWAGSTGVKIGAVVIGGLLIIGMVLSTLYWVPVAARNEHQRFQKEIAGYTSRGMTPAQAISEIKKERLEREQMAASQRAAQTQATATLSGFGMLASALNRK